MSNCIACRHASASNACCFLLFTVNLVLWQCFGFIFKSANNGWCRHMNWVSLSGSIMMEWRCARVCQTVNSSNCSRFSRVSGESGSHRKTLLPRIIFRWPDSLQMTCYIWEWMHEDLSVQAVKMLVQDDCASIVMEVPFVSWPPGSQSFQS